MWKNTMAIEFKLPEVSEGVESADIAEILVSEGDVIEAGQVVMEVETEKAVVELPCPHAGKITKVHVSEGDSVDVGGLLLSIEAGAEAEKKESPKKDQDGDAKKTEKKTEQKAEVKKAPEPAMVEETPVKGTVEPDTSKGVEEHGEKDPAVATEATAALVWREELAGPPAPAAPSTRRLARELNVDLNRVEGSGAGGRITQDDVKSHVRSRSLAPRTNDVSAPMAEVPSLPNFEKFGPIQKQPLNKIARTSANHLSMSWRTIPHVTQHDLADITQIEAARKAFMNGVGKNGPKITMTAIIIKACIGPLKLFPQFNASLDAGSNELVLKKYYHIGVAVDTENGLIVPVIRDCDQKSILEIADELTVIAQCARDRKLSMEDMQGGTFTITNLGGIGGTAFTPIINHPEVAILGMSRSIKQLELQNGQPVERLKLPLSLSYDHRVINGADAARFIVRLSHALSDFMALLVEL
jgi:pyruvate dehydrogenase E2 component (dihydrolipoamide acetyltransferase)